MKERVTDANSYQRKQNKKKTTNFLINWQRNFDIWYTAHYFYYSEKGKKKKNIVKSEGARTAVSLD